MKLMMFNQEEVTKQTDLFGSRTEKQPLVGKIRPVNDPEIRKATKIEEATEIISKRMAEALAKEISRVTGLQVAQ